LGVTQVSPRIPVPLDPTSFDLIDFDPVLQRLTIATDSIVEPGAIIVDPRIGTVTVRDVEQIFDKRGARAHCYCGSPTGQASRLVGALAALSKERVGVAGDVYLTPQRFRVVQEGIDGRLYLQPVDLFGAMPQTLPLSVWPGVPGVTSTLVPGTQVVVSFIGGDPSQPFVEAFDPLGTPLTLTLNAVSPGGVIVGGIAPVPVVKDTPDLDAYFTALEAALMAAGHTPTILWTIHAKALCTSTKLVTD
jgi:hypothetical protein